MSRLRLYVLGGVMAGSSAGVALPIARSCHSVMGYLIAHRHRVVTRTELAETLWDGHGACEARRCLSTALWRLRRATGPNLPPLLTFRGIDDVSINWAATVWIDAVALELRIAPALRRAPQALEPVHLRRLQRGILLHRGDFLAGMDADWVCIERERLRNLYFDGLYHLTQSYAAASDWARVLEWGRRLSLEEPLREDVHRLLMYAYTASGNRALALAQYRRCQRVLRTELGVEPMEETEDLYRQLSRLRDPGPVVEPSTGRPNLANVRRHVVRVQQVLTSSRQQLDHAIESLARANLQRLGE